MAEHAAAFTYTTELHRLTRDALPPRGNDGFVEDGDVVARTQRRKHQLCARGAADRSHHLCTARTLTRQRSRAASTSVWQKNIYLHAAVAPPRARIKTPRRQHALKGLRQISIFLAFLRTTSGMNYKNMLNS